MSERNSGTSTELMRDRLWSWGADLQPDGSASFRLWAPAHRRLWLRPSGGDALEMDGWFEIETRSMRPGDGYMFGFEDGTAIPDPASREQAGDVHGPSRLANPYGYRWKTAGWRGRPWHETVIYELHVGTFSPEGTFDGLRRRLDHLRDLGITAAELMPVAQFAGARGWGYDGVLPYAPHAAYGSPDALKALVDAAHERELMVFLDVVYNHFGPEGSYLHLLSPRFFHPERLTPWGAAIAYDEAPVRAFLVENALYWLEEFRFDGLRFDAVDQIEDPSADHILDEIARTVRSRITDRHVHLATEDDRNDVRHL
jgi:maltooligosyltrehalose trehalohydrolase